MALSKLERRQRIKYRIRKVVSGTASKPRLSVFRSNKEIYAQLIDDVAGTTLASVSSRDKAIASGSKNEVAAATGKAIADAASKAGIETCAFDRNGYLYHGRVKTLAEAAREAGLKF
ncbi:MAG: 50S ribosomal protein L18 [Bacteroidetes bacterium MedPE-SWsnd-G1]|uniref:Large ribosomal subunit protein uL18 n=1 Tax=Urechidicola vernalis TaxID=3075600 RepID=A0ABU2Y2Y4_9FLAO|nr:50S ribosomal protein L18 [Urechidicola sp. P050]MDT0552561.1 50S ribosomal protein L18 [Urechidicola sp. P050]OIQ37354.1 MAG: 50S ribosomal protein L18 [Bacteroidetes bacterium MedPE-SWsnd-G1]